MKFRASRPLTLGVELELMLLDARSGRLKSAAAPVLAEAKNSAFGSVIKAEITQAMIEVNSGVHIDGDALASDLLEVCRVLASAARRHGVRICGGGAHPFRDWPSRDVFPQPRFEALEKTYGYLARQFTVFGQHVHVGVASADDAIRLTHWLEGFIPHCIALSAASPYQRGVDTAFQSSRVNVATLFPLSGHMPACRSWREFAAYFARMQRTGLVQSMKDFYWDIRPKPEFGTVEVRVMDTPLSVQHAVDLAIFIRGIAAFGLRAMDQGARPARAASMAHEAYAVNRFRAARFGLAATVFDTTRGRNVSLRQDLTQWLDRIVKAGASPADMVRIERLSKRVRRGTSDANWLRRRRAIGDSWPQAMRAAQAQLLRW